MNIFMILRFKYNAWLKYKAEFKIYSLLNSFKVFHSIISFINKLSSLSSKNTLNIHWVVILLTRGSDDEADSGWKRPGVADASITASAT